MIDQKAWREYSKCVLQIRRRLHLFMRVCATLCVTFLFLALALPTFASIELLRNIPDVGDPNKSPQWYLIAIVGLSAPQYFAACGMEAGQFTIQLDDQGK
jgi:hypothetical protein